ncbi:MAG: hypothetical protein ACRDRZ_01620 [Pseudonocardiaceae bacterium]
MANASHDLGDTHAGMTQARAAYVCADNAGHDGLRAWVRGLQSLVAYWAGWPHEALRCTQLGAEAAARATGTAAAGPDGSQRRTAPPPQPTTQDLITTEINKWGR